MWELGNVWTDGRSTQIASYHAMMHEIHVLLVDHDSEGLINTAKLLEICQYRVTYVELASAAITMLSSGKTKFDIVMANINSPDLHGFKLLQFAVNIDVPVVLMSVDDNSLMAMRAIENGALLYIKKPATIEVLRCLWQQVLREKTRTIRERDRVVATNYSAARGIEFRDVIHHEEQNPNNVEGMTMIMKNKLKKKSRGRKGADDDEEYGSETHLMISNNVKRKMCTEWTRELHGKFMEAVEQLGEGRCFPKEILELMNVPGLTRMQVASHLQKCRNDNWRSPEERKSHQAIQAASSENHGSQYKPRRFGSKPQLGKALSFHSQESPGTGQGSETQSETDQMPNNGGHGNMAIMANTSHQQQYGLAVPDPTNGRPGPSNPRHPSDDFFNFPDMDCLIQNISGMPQGSGANNPNPGAHGAYDHFNPAYPEQNSAVDSRSQWSSETSNFGSDDSETRGNE